MRGARQWLRVALPVRVLAGDRAYEPVEVLLDSQHARIGTDRQIGNGLLSSRVHVIQTGKPYVRQLSVATKQSSEVGHGLIRSGLAFNQNLEESLDIGVHVLIVTVQ